MSSHFKVNTLAAVLLYFGGLNGEKNTDRERENQLDLARNVFVAHESELSHTIK